VTDGLDGLLYEAGDIDALAALLSRLAHDPDLRDRLREGGLRRAQDFTSAKIAPLVVDVYTGLLPTLQVTS
jgi:glycosyltransferase involved in cell wall biosynthesis